MLFAFLRIVGRIRDIMSGMASLSVTNPRAQARAIRRFAIWLNERGTPAGVKPMPGGWRFSIAGDSCSLTRKGGDIQVADPRGTTRLTDRS